MENKEIYCKNTNYPEKFLTEEIFAKPKSK